MLRKAVLATLITLPTYCFAWGQGFYVGLGTGADGSTFFQHAHFKDSVPLNPIASANVQDKVSFGATGIFGSLFGGYAWNWAKKLYVAAEINGDISSAVYQRTNYEFVHRNFSNLTSYKLNRSWGVTLVPGVFLPGDALLYGRVGYAGASFDINTTDVSILDRNTTIAGIRYGFGLEKALTPHFGLRMDYSHIAYESVNRFVPILITPPMRTITKDTHIKPTSNLFEIGAVYRFC